MRIETPRGWPEMTKPTPEEFATWFAACPAEERVEIARRALDAMDTAALCFEANHADLLDTLGHLHDHLGRVTRSESRYRAAWRSARRRGVWLLHRQIGLGKP